MTFKCDHAGCTKSYDGPRGSQALGIHRSLVHGIKGKTVLHRNASSARKIKVAAKRVHGASGSVHHAGPDRDLQAIQEILNTFHTLAPISQEYVRERLVV